MNLNDGATQFNLACGNYNNVTHATLLQQARLVKEEAEELFTAILTKEGDVQYLKESCDVRVVLQGMLDMLENLGYDVEGAYKAVNENNMSKLTDKVQAEYSQYFYQDTDPVDIEYNGGFDRYILRDKNGKVKKPCNYKKVCLKAFVPKEDNNA